MSQDDDFIMKMLKNKEQVIQSILKDIETSQKNAKAFQHLESLYEKGETLNVEKVLKAASKSLRHLNETNQRLLVVLLIYISGSSYESDVAKMLIKLGRGEDALKEMFSRKMQGK